MYTLSKTAKEFDTYYAEYDPCTETLLARFNEMYERNKDCSPYAKKAADIEYLCDNAEIKLFRHSPFFFEFSSGRERHSWGGLQSHVGSFLHEKTADLWLTPYENDMKKDFSDGRIHCWNNPVGFDHFTLGYDAIIAKGFSGIIRDAQEALEHSSEDKERGFLEALISSCKALIRLANRFSEKAFSLAEKATDSSEREHYRKIALAANNVPENPAAGFYEALCAIVFCREAIGSLEGIGVSTYGHIDRMLYPYYVHDLQNGNITYDEMKNCFHILFVYTDERFECRKAYFETSTTMVIGGCLEDGTVCYNDITKAVLEAVLEGRYVDTKVNCRISAAHPTEYIEKIAEVQAERIPILVVQNDDVLIPSRVKCGRSLADARLYVSGGCHEVTLQNTELCTRADTWINLSRILLDCMQNGSAPTFDAFYEQTLAAIKRFLLRVMETKNRYEKMWCKFDPLPLYSATMTGCIEKRKDATEGGTRYASTELSLMSPASFIDSLIAVKELVYDRKELSLSEFYSVCEENFEHHESLRKKIIDSLPKYGTNNTEADTFAAKVYRDIAALYRDENGHFYQNARGGEYLPAFYPHFSFVSLGRRTIATPDGRKAFTPLSRGCSPSEFNAPPNPASILQSLEHFDFTDFTDSFCTEITLQSLDKEKAVKVVSALIRVFLANKGSSMQFNIYDRATLIEAQKNPEQYGNICVRVCGYSAVFVTLNKITQDEIISRATR